MPLPSAPTAGTWPRAGVSWRYMRSQRVGQYLGCCRAGELIRNLPGPAGPEKIENDVTALAFSPDSQFLAVSYFTQPKMGIRSTSSMSRPESVSRSCILQVSADGPLFFLDEGKYLGYEDDGSFNVYETQTGKRVQQFSQHGAYAVSPDGRYLAAGLNSEERLKILDCADRPGSQGSGSFKKGLSPSCLQPRRPISCRIGR